MPGVVKTSVVAWLLLDGPSRNVEPANGRGNACVVQCEEWTRLICVSGIEKGIGLFRNANSKMRLETAWSRVKGWDVVVCCV